MSARENDTSRVRYLWKSLFATVVALQRNDLLLQMLIFETGTATLIRITALAALIAATPATAGNLALRLKENVLACHSSDTLEKITDIRTSGDKDAFMWGLCPNRLATGMDQNEPWARPRWQILRDRVHLSCLGRGT